MFSKPIFFILIINLALNEVSKGNAFSVEMEKENPPVPVLQAELEDDQLAEQYATLRHAIIHDLGYTKEFADLVEINLKRAIKEEIERKRQEGIVIPQRHRLRQE